MINNRYFPNSFFADHLILINFSAIFAYIVHKIKFRLLYNINVFYLPTLLEIIRFYFFVTPIIISNFGTLNCILCAMTAYSPTPKSLEK